MTIENVTPNSLVRLLKAVHRSLNPFILRKIFRKNLEQFSRKRKLPLMGGNETDSQFARVTFFDDSMRMIEKTAE